jgi:predicted LPLAT superfamily acyltransferase
MNPHWSERPEGGGRFALWLIRSAALHGGRRFARAFLYPATLYFYFRRPYERRVSREFLERATGRRAGPVMVLRHIHRFASTMLDRVFLLAEHFRRFDVTTHGLEHLVARMRPDRGVLLLGAHVGSFEVLRVAALANPEVKLKVVLDTQKTPALTDLLHALNPKVANDVIDGARPGPEIVLALGEALGAGMLATVLADRARPLEATADVDFLGAPAAFPVAPFRIAAILGVPVVLCLGMYRGGNRYDVHFEPLFEAGELPRRGGEVQWREAAGRYAARLEHHVRLDPCNWFNWHDFWNAQTLDRPAESAGMCAAGGSGG